MVERRKFSKKADRASHWRHNLYIQLSVGADAEGQDSRDKSVTTGRAWGDADSS
jgi:hypothetical protein